MRRVPAVLLALSFVLSCTASAVAHHAFAAEFDATKPFKIKGTVVKMEWINPHTWLHLDVKRSDGKTERRLGPGGTVIFPAGDVHQVRAVTRMVLYRVQAGADRHAESFDAWPKGAGR